MQFLFMLLYSNRLVLWQLFYYYCYKMLELSQNCFFFLVPFLKNILISLFLLNSMSMNKLQCFCLYFVDLHCYIIWILREVFNVFLFYVLLSSNKTAIMLSSHCDWYWKLANCFNNNKETFSYSIWTSFTPFGALQISAWRNKTSNWKSQNSKVVFHFNVVLHL